MAIGPWSSTYHCGAEATFPLPDPEDEDEGDDEDEELFGDALVEPGDEGESEGGDPAADDAGSDVDLDADVDEDADAEPVADAECEVPAGAPASGRPAGPPVAPSDFLACDSAAAAVATPPTPSSMSPPAANSTRRRLADRGRRAGASSLIACSMFQTRVSAAGTGRALQSAWTACVRALGSDGGSHRGFVVTTQKTPGPGAGLRESPRFFRARS
jgi:hypothetical protein